MAAEGSFSLSVKKFVEKTKLKPSLVIKKVSFDMLADLILMSPVLTGRFKGNWHIALGNPDSWTTEKTDKDGRATLSEGGVALEKAAIIDDVYILNNLKYAIPLEYGHSQQAPNGMVRITKERIPRSCH